MLQGRGIKSFIAGAGGAAHLPGMIASLTPLPVIGVPVKSSSNATGRLGFSFIYSCKCLEECPVATVAINGAKNAGILAAQIIGVSDKSTRDLVETYKKEMKEEVDIKSGKTKYST
jgi:5-(carboxyamino)imidazole ribonucleotide mutase